MLNFPFVCRLCLIPTAPNNSIEIFDETNEIPDKILELTDIQVLSGDGLPQEVCGVCRHLLDLSVTFKRQVSRADLMLREHLASTEEEERCITPIITGDPLTGDGKKEKSSAEEVGKGEEANLKTSEGDSNINPSGDRVGVSENNKAEEGDWAVAEPWPDLGETETKARVESSEQKMEDETSSNNEKKNTKENVDLESEPTYIPVTHIKLEGGGTLLFSLSEEEQDEDSGNELDLSCSDIEEKQLEEFKCPHCPKVFFSKRAVSGHQREHPQYCSSRRRDRKRPRDRNRTRNRERSHKQNRNKPLIDLGNKNENSEGNDSEKTIKSESNNSVGEEELKNDENKDGPRRSSRSTLGKAPERHVIPHYCCTKCERMFNDEAALENHMKMQHGMTYKCNHCGKKFTLKDSLEGHIRNYHLDVSIQKETKQHQEPLIINNNQLLKSHDQPRNNEQQRRNHNRSRRKSRHECNICGKSYENRSHLFSHMRSHKSTVHLCEICGKTVSLNTYPAHKRAHQNAESHEVFPCDTCGKKFNNKISLRNHKNSYHGTLKFTCEVCGKQFTTMALMRHHQYIHSGKRDHSCQVCGKAFTLKVTLKSHMRIHTGEMPYGCENCGRHFTWKTTYRNHVATCKKVQCDVTARNEVLSPNTVCVTPSDVRSEVPNTMYISPPPQPVPPPPLPHPPPMSVPNIPYMAHLPQELPLDYSEEAKYHAPIDYSEDSKYRFLPISIPDTKGFPPVISLREDIKYPYQQPLNFSGDVKLYRDVKSPH